jgi:hypothetical protein
MYSAPFFALSDGRRFDAYSAMGMDDSNRLNFDHYMIE